MITILLSFYWLIINSLMYNDWLLIISIPPLIPVEIEVYGGAFLLLPVNTIMSIVVTYTTKALPRFILVSNSDQG